MSTTMPASSRLKATMPPGPQFYSKTIGEVRKNFIYDYNMYFYMRDKRCAIEMAKREDETEVKFKFVYVSPPPKKIATSSGSPFSSPPKSSSLMSNCSSRRLIKSKTASNEKAKSGYPLKPKSPAAMNSRTLNL